MALERIGLGGIFTFNESQAVRATGRARDALGRFIRKSDLIAPSMRRMGAAVSQAAARIRQMGGQIGRGVGQIASGLRSAGVAALPLTFALGAGVLTAANFEQQMSAVGAITRGSAEDMQKLTSFAKKMGIESVFSAQAAGEAMEFMARSGATTDQVIGGLPGVLNAAAAEGLGLAEAADIVAQSTKIMGRTWEQAGNTADILVRASQSANTNVQQLGEAMRFGGLAARTAGLDMSETVGILAALADSGLSASTGGTALSNALKKLASPSREAKKLMSDFNIEMTRTAGGGVDLVNISQQLSDAMSDIQDPLEKTRIAAEIFGVRGGRAFAALAAAGEESTDSLIRSLTIQGGVEGAAAEAAERRLDNLKGQVTLLMSSIAAAAIEFFGPLLKPLKEAVQGITKALNQVVFGVQAMIEAGDDAEKRFEALTKITEKSGEGVANVILGITDAIKGLQEAFAFVKDTVISIKDQFADTFGGGSTRTIVKFGILFGIAAAAIAPLLIALGGIVFIISVVIVPIIQGLAAVISAVFFPVIIVLGVLALAFVLIRNEGESVGETLSRVWDIVKAKAIAVWTDGILPLWRGIKSTLIPIFEMLAPLWDDIATSIRESIDQIVQQFSDATGDVSTDWFAVGEAIGVVLGGIVAAVAGTIRVAVAIIGFLINAIVGIGIALVENVAEVFDTVVEAGGDVFDAFKMIFSGDIKNGLKKLGLAVLEFVLIPIKLVLRAIIQLSDAFGAEIVPDFVREFARAEGVPGAEISRGFAAVRGFQEPEAPPIVEPPTGARAELESLGRRVGARRAATTGAAAERTLEANVTLTNEQEVNVNAQLCVDGHEVAVAGERHRQEIGERSGFRATPFQRRVRIEQGAAPIVSG